MHPTHDGDGMDKGWTEEVESIALRHTDTQRGIHSVSRAPGSSLFQFLIAAESWADRGELFLSVCSYAQNGEPMLRHTGVAAIATRCLAFLPGHEVS